MVTYTQQDTTYTYIRTYWLYVCICICICMYVCMHICMHVRMFVCICKPRQGESAWCAMIDQEGVEYLLPLLLPSHPSPGDFNPCLSSLRLFLFYLDISHVHMYIFFCPALYLMFSAVDVASQGIVGVVAYLPPILSLPIFPLPFCDLQFPLLFFLHRVLSLLPSLDLDSMYSFCIIVVVSLTLYADNDCRYLM